MAKRVQRLVFAVNGRRYEVDYAPEYSSMTLLEFLRTRTPFTGPKLGCGEGGCGACTVLLSKYDPTTDQISELSASSCLTLLSSINYCSITTSEGLGNSKDGFHSIQQRLAGFHASQCGFCTPGMCMSIFSALIAADKSNRPEPPKGFSKLTMSEAENAIAGNICRCTGYRPIVDACKSFSAEVDLEDLGLNIFWTKGGKDSNVTNLPNYTAAITFPEFLKSEIKSSLNCANNCKLESSRTGWYRPDSVEELYEMLNSDAFNGNFDRTHVRFVVGNTRSGVYKDDDLYDTYIELQGIPELSVIKRSDKGIEIGAVTTISKTIELLREDKDLVFSKLADHMSKVASRFIRNTASIGGNIIMAQRDQFASDIATILLAVNSTVSIQIGCETTHLTLEEFLQQPPCDSRTLLLSIFIPFGRENYVAYPEHAAHTAPRFETYRAAPRPRGNAVAYVNAAFLAHITVEKSSGSHIVNDLCLAFGAYGCQHAIRARKVEKFMKGKLLTARGLLEAIQLLKETIVPNVDTRHPEYRVSLAVGFLFSFLSPLVKGLDGPLKTVSAIVDQNGDLGSGHEGVKNLDVVNLPLSSKQEIPFSEVYSPVGAPTKKAGAELQASGEAVYVDDIPSPKDCLYGAFVYGTKPLARVNSLKFQSSLASQKIINVVSAKDIPTGGQNIGSSFLFYSEPLLADSLVDYAGQPIAVVIAETQRYAKMAAKQAIFEYEKENLNPPILTVEEAVQNQSFFEIPPFLAPKEVGNAKNGMEEADQKIISAEVKFGSQYYFYMETQSALAVPDEDNCMVVYFSTQVAEVAQSVIAKCLGIPFNNVRVITRRVGGGFGGKAFRGMQVATACALAAYKLRRPVRMYLDRKTDMIMIGGRHPMHVRYSVGFKYDGKITALQLNILINCGIFEDISPLMPKEIIGSLNKYNWGSLGFDIKLCKTNLTSKSAMRAPGTVQGTFIAETIIEHVASALSIDPNTIRRMNLHTFDSLMTFHHHSVCQSSDYTLRNIFDKLVSSPSYLQRVEAIHEFNAMNKWRKRGISCVPVIYEVNMRPTPGKVSVLNDGSIVVEVGGIEIGQGLWTKVKQMAALTLGQLLSDGSADLFQRVRVIQVDTLSLIQGGMTAGSTTSESSCEAVRQCCGSLVSRLNPLKDRLQAENGTISWNQLILQASSQSINLSASTLWVPDSSASAYLNYGAATSEVEIDLLTGATTIIRTDIVYDSGQSLNPAIDLGQIEGAFIQGIGFCMYEECLTNADGLEVHDGTWTYKVPTVDTIPKQFNVEMISSGDHQNRVLSSKASGEPPLLLAASVHCAMREAIRAARKEFSSGSAETTNIAIFQMDIPTTMPLVKELCGLDLVEKHMLKIAKFEA